MSMDSITETIAHFIGFFHIAVENARMREGYEKFLAGKEDRLDPEALAFDEAQFNARFQLGSYVPEFSYEGPAPSITPYYVWSNVTFAPPVIPMSDLAIAAYPGWLMPIVQKGSQVTFVETLPEIDPLGSVVNLLFQKIGLSDNDYFSVGGHGLFFAPTPVSNQPLLDFADDALSLSPLGTPELPGSAAEFAQFVRSAADSLKDFTGEDAPEGVTIVVEAGPRLDGNYLNGVKVDELPKLSDYYDPEGEGDTDEDSDGESVTLVVREENSASITASVTVEAGGNTLVNTAAITSFWTAATVTAVMGDHIELSAIIQINAWMDQDAVSPLLACWTNEQAATQAFNLASFSRYDTHADMQAAIPDAPARFPEHWVVTRVDGDVMIVNWLQQFTFMSDNDIGILSSSGVTTKVIAGENMAINQISIFEMAFAYDLIVIGGNVYDANIIQQMNVLFDNDLIGAVDGFATTGQGNVSTSGNLLWNGAEIYDVGGADRFETLPAAYKAFAESLADGGKGVAGDVLNDPAFANLGAIKVLYISGDLIKLNYVSQTNILGDSDQIALAMNAITPVADAEWTIATGGNNLINLASIADLDSLGKTYVGGQQYSQEILIQAEFVPATPDFLGARDPDALVNEAVAFLVDDTTDEHGAPGNSFDPGYHPQDAGQGDGLQSMLA